KQEIRPAQEMGMAIDERGHHKSAVQINHLRAWAGGGFDRRIADRGNAPPRDAYRIAAPAAGAGPYAAVDQGNVKFSRRGKHRTAGERGDARGEKRAAGDRKVHGRVLSGTIVGEL